MAWTVLTIFVAIAVVLAVLAVNRPAEFRIERHALISAPPSSIFPLINDLRAWKTWSPWEGLDLNLKRSYAGPTSGTGSAYSWEGNAKVGAGRMEILDAIPDSFLKLKIDFLRPFKATNIITFTLNSEGTGTRVVWIMEGRNAFMMKLFAMAIDTDKLIGKDFEKGLASLAVAVESPT